MMHPEMAGCQRNVKESLFCDPAGGLFGVENPDDKQTKSPQPQRVTGFSKLVAGVGFEPTTFRL